LANFVVLQKFSGDSFIGAPCKYGVSYMSIYKHPAANSCQALVSAYFMSEVLQMKLFSHLYTHFMHSLFTEITESLYVKEIIAISRLHCIDFTSHGCRLHCHHRSITACTVR